MRQQGTAPVVPCCLYILFSATAPTILSPVTNRKSSPFAIDLETKSSFG